MRLRVAKKIIARLNRGDGRNIGLARRAARRYFRWRHRPVVEGSVEYGFHWCDERGRVHKPSGNLLDDATRWGLTKRRYFTEFGEDKWVSTIFLGLDHAYGAGKPLWFETAMQMPGQRVEILNRHHDIQAAREFHEMVAAALKHDGIWVKPVTE
jgi:hypothetical protein